MLAQCQDAGTNEQTHWHVICAGGVLRDALIPRQTAEGVRAVFAPKVAGAAGLLADASCAPLSDGALLFSSAAVFIGSAGQANYAAANAGLDSMAGCLQAAGCPGTLTLAFSAARLYR